MAKVEEPQQGTGTPAPGGDALEHVNVSGAEAAVRSLRPELAANSLGEYASAWLARVKSGESGVLPVLVGLVAISIIFQVQNSKFLGA